MAFEFKFPDVGEGIAEGEILAWKVKEGDSVVEGQTLVEIETDKAVVELPSPRAGRVTGLRGAEGDVINVGDVLVSIEEEAPAGGAVDAGGIAAAPAPGAAPLAAATPAEAAPTSAEPPAEAAPTSAEPPLEAAPPYTGSVVGFLEEAPEETEPAPGEVSPGAVPAPSLPEPGPGVLALPSIRALAKELGVDLNLIRGTGSGGRILKQDVLDVAQMGAYGSGVAAGTRGEAGVPGKAAPVRTAPTSTARAAAVAPSSPVPTPTAPAAVAGSTAAAPVGAVPRESPGPTGPAPVSAAPVSPAPPFLGGTLEESEAGMVERVAFKGVRRTMAKRMAESASRQAQVTVTDEADATVIRRIREKGREAAQERGVRLTYLAFVVKACTASLRRFPRLNASLAESQEEYFLKHYYNIGIAVDTPSGLMVPNIKAADQKSIFQIAAEIIELVTRAEERRLEVADLHGGTFTITNFGAIGSTFATPIVNYPEVAILGMGRVREMPVVRDGQIVTRLLLPLSLTFDHQLIDGAEATRFLNMVIGYLEDPDLLLLEGA